MQLLEILLFDVFVVILAVTSFSFEVRTDIGRQVTKFTRENANETEDNSLEKLIEDYKLNTSKTMNNTNVANWAYDLITTLAIGFGVVPAGLLDHGLQFTILLASFDECLATLYQIHYNLEYNLVNMFDRILFGKLDPEQLLKTKKVQSIPGTFFTVNHVKKNGVEIGHHVVDTTSYFILPFNRGIIYTKTYPEPK